MSNAPMRGLSRSSSPAIPDESGVISGRSRSAMLLMTCSADLSSATPPQMQSDFMKILIQIKARRLQRTYVSQSAVGAASVLKGGPCVQVRSRRRLKCRRSARRRSGRRSRRQIAPTPSCEIPKRTFRVSPIARSMFEHCRRRTRT